MAQYDGSININTKIDSGGFNTGIKSMIGSVAKLGAAIGVAFGIKKLVDFTANVTQLSAEFDRLQIAAEAVGLLHGYAADETNKLTQSLIDNGIQTDIANRAYINFASNGLDAKLLPALARGAQDLAVFADNGETSSDVLNSLSYGILTLNELMLRRAGVAIDISNAEAKYAQQIGVSTAALTVQQKRAAVTNAVLEKLKDTQGLYALSQQTAAGQLSSNVRIMNEFKAAIGEAFQGAFFRLIKSWNDLIKVMTASIKAGGVLHDVFVNIGTVAAFLADIIGSLFQAIASLFGVKLSDAINTASGELDTNASAANDAATAQDNLAGATEAAGKAAKGALASFDELNVLQQDTGNAGAGAGGGAGAGFPDTQAADFSKILDDINAKQKEIQDRVDALKKKFMDFLGPVIPAFDRLVEALKPLGQTIWSGLQWAWENILKPFGVWLIQTFGPIAIELFAAWADVWSSTWDSLGPILNDLWQNILKPVAEFMGKELILALQQVTKWLKDLKVWIDNNQTAWGIIVAILLGVVAAFALIASGVGAIILLIGAIIIILANAGGAWDIFVADLNLGIEIIRKFWERDVNLIKDMWIGTFDSIKKYINATIENIAGLITGKLNLSQFFKAQLNNIIGFINGVISRMANAINVIIGNLNALGTVLPGFQAVGYVTAPQIPYLATGAVIPPNAEFLAMLGDQKSGRNIEAPEALIRQIIREEVGNVKADIKVEFTGTLAALARELKPKIDAENVRIGKSMVTGGAA